MNEQELNKKPAEWVGVKVECGETGKPIINDGQMFVCFTRRDGTEDWEWRPMFTQSLDAIFKWLVPEALKRFGEVKMLELFMNWGFGLVDCKEPALALCKAVEKLIDELP